MREPVTSEMELHIPFLTMLKVALFLLLVFLTIKIVPLIAIIYVAAMVAVVISAAAGWMERHRVRRSFGLTLVAASIFVLVLLFLFVVVPSMFAQVRQIIADLPRIAQRLERELPAAAPYIRSITAQAKSPPNSGNLRDWLARGAIAGWYAVEAIAAIFMTLVMAVYFALQGKKALAWLFSFAPMEKRRKLVQTAEEVEPVMLAYMRGQLITSSLAAAVALVTALALHLPAAIPLAFLAFVGDFVPVLGFISAVVPAVLLALLRSPLSALIVIAAYAAYHVVENYYVVPIVYGSSMRLSSLAVLLTVATGGMIAGPAGAVLVLPIAAAYPPIERIWLSSRLAPDTIRKHDAIEGDDEERADAVAEDVLRADERRRR
ncbi:MAG TPA: AI-2E family transporter [Thermoanaerobaculia bacterium]